VPECEDENCDVSSMEAVGEFEDSQLSAGTYDFDVSLFDIGSGTYISAFETTATIGPGTTAVTLNIPVLDATLAAVDDATKGALLAQLSACGKEPVVVV
jgi:hypothetical protein